MNKRATGRMVLALATGLIVATAAVAAREGPVAFIDSLGQDVIGVLSARDLQAGQRERDLERLLVKGFDIERVARFVLGRYWRNLNDAQRQKYLQLFRDYVVRSYAGRFTQYSGETFAIKDSRSDSDGETLVLSVIERPYGPPVKVDWRVRVEQGDYKIVDVVIEGVSMAITHRAEFASVLQNNGGNIEDLFDRLRRRLTATR